jgi:TrfA protein
MSAALALVFDDVNSRNIGLEIIKNTEVKNKLREQSKLLEQVQLPLWQDEMRAVPNGILRSALFAAIQPGARRYIDGESIAALSGVEIKYTGQQLDQGDLGVWEAVLHVAQEHNLGNRCQVSTYKLLRLLGLKDSGNNRKVIYKRLTRLVATALQIKQGRYEYIGGLINEAARDDKSGQMYIVLNQKIISLFQRDQYTKIHFELCHTLKRPAAQWLYRFYASHASPYPLLASTIFKYCGSNARSLNDFKKNTLRPALDELEKVSTRFGSAYVGKICNGLVDMKKVGSTSQKKHLRKKITVDKLPS